MADKPAGLAALSLAALGVVYGDIGTSPLYAFKVAYEAGHHAGLAPVAAATGVCSLIIWSLVVVVSIKYAILILSADNHGEGGVVAMLALLGVHQGGARGGRVALLIVGLVGAALLYGDGAITPAISVLSAVRGSRRTRRSWGPMCCQLLWWCCSCCSRCSRGARALSAACSGR